jgi:DNA polymerase III epsilon subunit-like protein
MKKLIFLDTETTGNEIGKDRLCQVCYKNSCEVKVGFFKPPLPMSVKSMSITHITNKMLADKECFEGSAMQKELKKLLKDGILVAHNAKFDIAMLESEGIKVLKFICTLRVARYLDKENKIPEYNLQFLRYYLDLDIDAHAHEAEDDVKVLHALFLRLLDKVKESIKEEDHEKSADLVASNEKSDDLVASKAIEKMIEISRTPSLFNKFNFGKHKDERIEDVMKTDKRYLEWLLSEKQKNEAGDEDWIYTLKHYLKK